MFYKETTTIAMGSKVEHTLLVRRRAAVSRYRSRDSAGLSLQSLIHSSTLFCTHTWERSVGEEEGADVPQAHRDAGMK